MAQGFAVKPCTLGVSAGPEDLVLMSAVNLDVNSNLDFNVLGPCEAVEVTIVSGTAKTGAPSVVFNLQVFDVASQTFITVLSSAALTDAGNAILTLGHDVPIVANKSNARVVRGAMRLNVAYTGTPATDVLNNTTVTVSAV